MTRGFILPLGLPFLVIAWFLLTETHWVNPFFIPKPNSVLEALASQVNNPTVWKDIGITTARALAGLLLSAVTAIPIGLMLGRSPTLYRHFALPIDFVRSIPSATLFPLFILIFGIGNTSKVAVVFYGCFFIILMTGIYGARPTAERQRRILMMQTLRARPAAIYLWVVLPDALLSIIVGLRVAASTALVLVVVTEMFFASNDGLGKRIYDFYLSFQIPEMYASIALLGILGYVLNGSMEMAERRYRTRFGG